MRLFRRRTSGRRFLLISVVALGGAAISYAAYPTSAVTVMTGCLAGNGTLIDCWDQGTPWPTNYHVIAMVR
jgi:hypothetical protein